MISLNQAQKKLIINLFKIAAIIIFISNFAIDLENTVQYGGIDLRARVVGARLLASGKDPYYFSWEKGQPDQLLDPLDNPDSTISRVTVPPSSLTLHTIISSYSFFNQKIIWLIIQWASFLAILTIFLKKSEFLYQKFLVSALSLAFINSHFWRLHIERGQIYIIYALLSAIAWLLISQSLKFNHFLGGVLIGITSSLRPSALLIVIPFLIYKKFSVLVGSLFGLAVGVSIPFIFSNHLIWNSYFSTILEMRHYVSAYSHSISEGSSNLKINIYPQIIEGLDNLREVKDIPIVNSSLFYLMSRLGINDFNKSLILVLAIAISMILLIFLRIYIREIFTSSCLLLGIILYLTGDFFIPSPRYSYVDIQWILPLLIVFSKTDPLKFLSIQSTALLSLGLILSIGKFNWIPYFLQFGVYLIALSTIFLSIKLVLNESKATKLY